MKVPYSLPPIRLSVRSVSQVPPTLNRWLPPPGSHDSSLDASKLEETVLVGSPELPPKTSVLMPSVVSGRSEATCTRACGTRLNGSPLSVAPW